MLNAIRNPTGAQVGLSLLLLFIPFLWPLTLYMVLRYATGHRTLSPSEVWAESPVPTKLPAPDASGAIEAAVSTSATKICPDCAETVLTQARVCRFCRHEFTAGAGSSRSSDPGTAGLTIRVGGVRRRTVAIAAALLLVAVVVVPPAVGAIGSTADLWMTCGIGESRTTIQLYSGDGVPEPTDTVTICSKEVTRGMVIVSTTDPRVIAEHPMHDCWSFNGGDGVRPAVTVGPMKMNANVPCPQGWSETRWWEQIAPAPSS